MHATPAPATHSWVGTLPLLPGPLGEGLIEIGDGVLRLFGGYLSLVLVIQIQAGLLSVGIIKVLQGIKNVVRGRDVGGRMMVRHKASDDEVNLQLNRMGYPH